MRKSVVICLSTASLFLLTQQPVQAQTADPAPSISGYATKKYGEKTWMTENLKWRGSNPETDSLGWFCQNNPEKGALYGSLYTWEEAMTGIPQCAQAQNPIVWGATGTDVAGHPYTINGSVADSYNLQIQGVCPNGWHIPNMNDWYDLLAAIKTEYNVPSNTLAEVQSNHGGYFMANTRQIGLTLVGCNLTAWGAIPPYLKGSTAKSKGGLWADNVAGSAPGSVTWTGTDTTFTYNTYTNIPLFADKSAEIGFNVLPGGRRTAAGVFDQEGMYDYQWTAFIQTDNNKPVRTAFHYNNVNLGYGQGNRTDGFSVRCVENYDVLPAGIASTKAEANYTFDIINNTLNINGLNTPAKISVFDIFGKNIAQTTVSNGNEGIVLPGKGLFLIQITTDNAVKTIKVIL